MAETTCERFHKTAEDYTNKCRESKWEENKGSNSQGKVSVLWPFPADSYKHDLGRTLPSVELLYKASNQESDAQEAKELSQTEAGRFKETYHKGGNKKQIPPMYNKHYTHDTRQQNKEIHGQDFSKLNTSKTARINDVKAKKNETKDMQVKGQKYDDISKGEFCPNRERINTLYSFAGQLLRVGTIGSVEGLKWTCRFVQPYYRIGRDGSQRTLRTVSESGTVGCCNNSPMVIEIIANESERHQLALSLGRRFYDVSSLTECMNAKSGYGVYFNEVQEFGFNHILLVGKRDYGIMFIDCYGHVFELDRMSDALWPLGNSLEEVATNCPGRTALGVDDNRIVYEFEYYTESELTTHIFNTDDTDDTDDTESQDNLNPQKLDQKKIQKSQNKNKNRKKNKSKKNGTIF